MPAPAVIDWGDLDKPRYYAFGIATNFFTTVALCQHCPARAVRAPHCDLKRPVPRLFIQIPPN